MCDISILLLHASTLHITSLVMIKLLSTLFVMSKGLWALNSLCCTCRRNLLNVLDLLKKPNASTLVSGTRDRVNLHDKFRNAIEASFPGTIDQLKIKAVEKEAQQKKLSFWESVTDSKAGAFKFSF